MVGDRYGKLVIVEQTTSNTRGERMWVCKCDCGNTKIVKTQNLKKGYVKSCGCIKTGPKDVDYVGHKFNRLTVLERVGRTKCRQQKYLCECVCGERVVVNLNSLKGDTTKSCGCFKLDLMKSRCGENSPSFDPNLTKEDRERGRHIPNYINWVNSVKIKYNKQWSLS